MVVIGSEAIRRMQIGLSRQPKDYDIICTKDELLNWMREYYHKIKYLYPTREEKFMCRLMHGRQIEFEVATLGSSAQLILDTCYSYNFSGELPEAYGMKVQIAPIEVSFAIKKSHLFVPLRQWEKHISDYHLMKPYIDKLEGDALDIYTLRKKETLARKKLPKINLNKSNSEFFQGSEEYVQRIYNHDDVHKAVAYYDQPMYAKIKKDQSLAACDKELFFALSYHDQLKCVLEESYVIALERRLIPSWEANLPMDPVEAFKYGLYRICTTLTSGWFREFSLDNYPTILKERNEYDVRFTNMVKSGIIKRKSSEDRKLSLP